MRYQRAETPLTLDGYDAACAFFAGCFADADPMREHLFVAHLDAESRCIHLSRHAGDAAGAPFPIRTIVADAAIHGSAGIVLAHNHPSGVAAPSSSDLQVTRRLATATEAVDCTILDHLVFGGGECASLRRLGYL